MTDKTPQNESTRASKAKAQEPKAQEPEHLYDAPGLTALQFLAAVMHNPHTPLHVRIDAADRLMHLCAHLDIPANMHGAYIRGELGEVLTYVIPPIKLQ